MNTLADFTSTCGSQRAAARRLGVTQAELSLWLAGKRPVPIERCVQIERATEGAVTRITLRPDDWPDIWPELAERHPNLVPAQAAQQAG